MDNKLNKKLTHNNLNETINELIPQFLLNKINDKEDDPWSLNKLKEDTVICDMVEHEHNHFNLENHTQKINQEVFNINKPNRNRYHSSGNIFSYEHNGMNYNDISDNQYQQQMRIRNLHLSPINHLNLYNNQNNNFHYNHMNKNYSPHQYKINNNGQFNNYVPNFQQMQVQHQSFSNTCSPSANRNNMMNINFDYHQQQSQVYSRNNSPIIPPKKNNSSSNVFTSMKANDKPVKSKKSSLFNQDEEYSSLEELLEKIDCGLAEYIKSQKGSRIMQKMINRMSPEGIDNVMFKLKDNFSDLLMDTYGNYFCQKLIQTCTSEQRINLFTYIRSDFTTVSLNNSGTHALQSLIEIANSRQEEEIILDSVKYSIIEISLDTNGTHVIQKIVSSIPEDRREYINKIILENFNKFIIDANGVCVIKKLINSNKENTLRTKLLELVLKDLIYIIQNPFGNYVIQYILFEWDIEYCRNILLIISQNIISLSMQKFSSNVVEKCFEIKDKEIRAKLYKELFNFTKISSLMKNKYSNFVIQKAIKFMLFEEKLVFKEELKKRIDISSVKERARLTKLIEMI